MGRDAQVFRRLEAHAARRRAGIPTVTVLAGPRGLGAPLFERWCLARGGAVVEVEATALAEAALMKAAQAEAGLRAEAPAHAEAAALAWIDALGAARLREIACAAVAERSGDGVERVRLALGCRSAAERALWLGDLWPDPDAPEAVVCRALLDTPAGSDEPPSARVIGAFAGVAEPSAVRRALIGLLALSPDLDRTALLLARRDPERGELEYIKCVNTWEDEAAALADLVASVPAFPAAVIAPESAGAALREAPPSRARSLLAEGVVEVPAVSAAEVAEQAAEDRARSAAERFLFERLAALPATAGLFELNARVRGEGSWEVDLLARGQRVAIEIDGYYHFRDPDAYRVDRRKDLFLQQHGYLVLRFLAGDVVSRLEEILAAVTGALRRRQETPMKEAGT